MAESHVVSGLVSKRSELAGLVEHHRQEIARLGGDLAHLDATIKLFAPDMDIRSVRPKEHRQRNSFFRPGEGPRAILDALRIAGEPLTSRQIVERIMGGRGVELTPHLIEAVQKSLLVAIKGLETKKLVRVVSVAKGNVRSWQIA